ncbi:hypothetical protein P3S67_007546 [Capsicum chacoense]
MESKLMPESSSSYGSWASWNCAMLSSNCAKLSSSFDLAELPSVLFIAAQDFTTQAALYTHHQYIAGFIMTGAFAHGAIFFIRDYNPEQNEDNVLARMLDHKEAIISHLSWASLFLGFHTLGLYVHNDVMLAFGTPEKQILIEPIFAQWIQSAHGKTSYGFRCTFIFNEWPSIQCGSKHLVAGLVKCC